VCPLASLFISSANCQHTIFWDLCAVPLQDFLINILLTILGYIPGGTMASMHAAGQQQWPVTPHAHWLQVCCSILLQRHSMALPLRTNSPHHVSSAAIALLNSYAHAGIALQLLEALLQCMATHPLTTAAAAAAGALYHVGNNHHCRHHSCHLHHRQALRCRL
jgi:hypothetical protein